MNHNVHKKIYVKYLIERRNLLLERKYDAAARELYSRLYDDDRFFDLIYKKIVTPKEYLLICEIVMKMCNQMRNVYRSSRDIYALMIYIMRVTALKYGSNAKIKRVYHYFNHLFGWDLMPFYMHEIKLVGGECIPILPYPALETLVKN